MGKGPVIAGLVVLILIVGGVFALTSNSTDDKNVSSNTGQASGTNKNVDTTGETKDTVATATITYDGTSFSPALTTVQSGDKITIKNTSSSADLEFASDPHPVHTDDTDLNAGSIDPGQSKTITVTKKGSFGFHNHHNQSQHGNITIQ